MAERLADRPGVLHRRRESAEHPFGSIKHWMGHGGFLMRRLENVWGEFSLTALAYNIRRATTLVGIPELIAAWGVQTSWNRPPPRTCCNASGRMASANRRQPTHGPNPRPLTPQNPTRAYFSHSRVPLRTAASRSCTACHRKSTGPEPIRGLISHTSVAGGAATRKPCRIQAISLILAGRLLLYMSPTTAGRKRSPSAVATAVWGLAGVFLLIEIPACVDGFLRRPACGKIAGLRA